MYFERNGIEKFKFSHKLNRKINKFKIVWKRQLRAKNKTLGFIWIEASELALILQTTDTKNTNKFDSIDRFILNNFVRISFY